MTIEEKRKAVVRFCKLRKGCIQSEAVENTCPLWNTEKGECMGAVLDDKTVERSYDIITGRAKREAEPVNVILHAAICDELKDLYQRKNTDYGDSFHKTFIEEGMPMARIRLSDKLERFKRLTRSGEQNVKDESIRDTLIDLANYAIMTIVEMERVKHD